MPGVPPPHDPIEASLTSADDRVRLNHWLPPQAGVMPKIRIGRLLDQFTLGAADRLRPAGCRCGHRPGSPATARRASISRALPGRAGHCRHGHIRVPALASDGSLPQPVLHGVHHPRWCENPCRSPAALLAPRLHAGHRVVPFPEGRSGGPDLDRQGRFGDCPELAWHSAYPSFHRSRALVAFLGEHALDAQRRRHLRPAVLDRPVAAGDTDHLGGDPERGLDRPAIPVAHVPRGP